MPAHSRESRPHRRETLSYYQTNAIYERLAARDADDFVWTSGNAWMLVYGDGGSRARLVAFVIGETAKDANTKALDRLRQARRAAKALARKAGLAFATIAFDDAAEEIESVTLDGRRVSLDDLADWFQEAGLPVRGGNTRKAINDASSSAYHQWQRARLGAIRVSDIDLIHMPKGDRPTVYELKRSFLPLQRWSPYPADFANFDLIDDLCSRAGAQFRILYNVRHKAPRVFDDPSRLALFDYTRAAGSVRVATLDFEAFA